MDGIYKLIIVGGKADAQELLKYVSKNNVDKKSVLVVADEFSDDKMIEGIHYVCSKVVHTTFVYGLFGLHLSNGSVVHGTKVVLATETKPTELDVQTFGRKDRIFYNLGKISTVDHDVAIVYGSDERAADYTLKLAHIFKVVYLINPEFELQCSTRCKERIEKSKRITYLPMTSLTSVIGEEDLVRVCLSTYDSIEGDALFVSVGRIPDISGISKQIIALDGDKLKTTNIFESVNIHNLFAVGDLIRGRQTQEEKENLIRSILK